MEKILITGYSSKVVKELTGLIYEQNVDVEIIKFGRGVDSDYHVDFSSIAECKKFLVKLNEISPAYLLINHGVLPGDQIIDTSDEDIWNSLSVNLISYLFIIESLTKAENIKTVIMSSISGKAGSYDTLYAAAKAGIDVTIRRISSTIPYSSRLNAVSPGIIKDARMTTVRTDLEVLENKRRNTPTKQFTTSLDVAKLIYFILFESDNLSGENINLNGGMYIK